MIDGLHFLRPEWLLLLPVAGVVCWLLVRRRDEANPWRRQFDPRLIDAQMDRQGARRGWGPGVLLGIAWLIAITALAGPSWQQHLLPVYSELDSRIIVFDLSRSMDSNDLPPSRLVRARYKLSDLVTGGGARQQGLVVFAGDAFVVSPMTDDRDTLTNLIPALNTDTVPVQGSRPDLGLSLSAEMIKTAGFSNVELVYIGDSANADSLAIAERLATGGHTLHVIAVGTAAGAPIAAAGGGLVKDAQGNIVIPGVDHQRLRRLAQSGGGQYFELSANGDDVAWLNREETLPLAGGGPEAAEQVAGSGGTLRWLDGGVWLLLPLVLLASLGFRRGLLLGPVIGVFIGSATVDRPAHAFGWDDLWQRPDQRAARALVQEAPESVPQNASPAWRGAAAYRQQQFDEARSQYESGSGAVDHYNRGNALAKSGDLAEALTAWEQAMVLDPAHEDARFNHELVSKLLQQQQQQSSDNQQGEGEGEQQQQQRGEQNQEQSGDQEQQADQQSDQQRSDQDAAESDQGESGQENEQAEEQEQQAGQMADGDSEQTPMERENESLAATDPETMSEEQQALQQWLQQVPDDPGGLLRRKFRYQYSRRESPNNEAQAW